MRLGELGWVLALAGLPWSYFLIRLITPFKDLDIWHANTWWMQGWILVLAGVHAMNKKALGVLPASLWWLVIWSTLLNLWMLNAQSKAGQPYALPLLPALGNLWMVVLALLVMSAWDASFLKTLAIAIFWSGVGLVCYGWLQVVNLDQFFRAATMVGTPDLSVTKDYLVGMMGNPTHFACQMALWIPFALCQPRYARLWIIPALGLVWMASSSTALAMSAFLLVSWVWQHSRRMGVLTAVGLSSLGTGLLWWKGTFWLNPFGRWETWSAWWPIIQRHPILGHGLGFVKNLTQQLPSTHPLFGWKHLHNEYYQVWVELGIIGLLLVGWAAWQLWQRRHHGTRSSLRWAYGSSFLACALMGLLNFTFHLWQLGGWGLMGLAGWLVLTEKVI